MKYLLIPILALLLFGCSPQKKGVTLEAKPQSEGGVDVGNLTTGLVPKTNASLSFPSTWSASTSASTLSLQNSNGSTILAKKAELSDLSSPNPTSLKLYLKEKFPNREYKTIEINGLKGVRADFVDTLIEKQSDIYLVSEVNDFINIQSLLKNENSGITTGDEIILTARVKYKGEPVLNSKVNTINLNAYSSGDQLDPKAAYSFKDDCYSYIDQGCRGVSVLFGNGGGSNFSVGNAGYHHGRIVELGSNTEVPFDSIKIEGEYLVAPLTKVSIADIYTAFTPKNQQAELNYLSLKEDRVYLIRTISWPDEDLIVKMEVESLLPGKSVVLKYQKLAYVRPEVLAKQVDEINKFTLENEKPLIEGEVTLHNQSIWNNYFYASFNFENSTSGNMFITNNNWDISFSNGCSGKPVLNVPHTGSAIGKVVDFGKADLKLIGKSDFPDPNLYSRDCGQEVQKGNVYGIYHHRYDEDIGAIYGAVKVLDIASDNSWIRLKFRRIYLGKAEHFQNWIELKIPEGIRSAQLVTTESSKSSVFYPFIGMTGLEGFHYFEAIYFTPGSSGRAAYFGTDNRPYGNDRGFFNLGATQDFSKITLEDVENYKGKFEMHTDLKQGDIFAVYLENYFNKTVMVIRIDSLQDENAVKFSYRYLARAKTLYSDDKE